MSDWTDSRPRSPHLQVWRWHITMATSIFHRASGIALYIGAGLVTTWLVAAATSPAVYDQFEALFLTLPGQLLLFAFTIAIVYHLGNGLRYLFWDRGVGYSPKVADTTAWLVIVGSIIGAGAIWVLADLL